MPEKPSKLLPALYGGIIMGAISGIPFLSFLNCFCCAGVMLGGLMSVFFYKNNLAPNSPPLTSGDSLQLGLLAGVFGAVIGTLIHVLIMATFGNVAGEALMQILRSMEGTIPPEALEQIERSMGESTGLGALALLSTFFLSIVIDPLFGLLGGLIGYSIFKPKQQMTNVQPPMNPPAQTSV